MELPQSHIVMSDIGYFFQPEEDADWLDDMFVSSLTECIHRCNENNLCRTFDYNYDRYECRLFQVEPSSDEINYDSSLQSQLGYIQLLPEFFSAYNQTCNYCENERYLICVDDLCQCPWNTFWDGSICRKRKYAGSFCSSSQQCQTYNYNLRCISANICTSKGYPTNVCGVNKNILLFNDSTNHLSSNGNGSYTLYTFNITAQATSMTVTFSLSNTNGYWLLDNISLIDVITNQDLILNGDFETGNLTSWNYCNPNSTLNASQIGDNLSLAQSGYFYYYGGPHPSPDFLSQTVSTSIARIYQLSFWLKQYPIGTKSNCSFISTIFF